MGRSSSPQAPGLYPNGIDPNDFGTQNRMADAGVYQAGTVGADNALANGTGMVLGPDGSLRGQPPAAAAPAAPGPTHADPATTVRTVTGSPADAQALSGLYPSTGGRGASAPGLYPPVAGLNAATSVDNLRAAFDSDRVFRTQIEPYIPTPGMAPEAAASRFGYLDKLALRSAGVPEAAPGPLSTVSGDGWLRGRNAAEPITLPGGEKALAPGQKLPPETDINRSRVAQLATLGRNLVQAQTQPHLRNLGKDSSGNAVEGILQPRTGDFTRIKPDAAYPRSIKAGARNLLEVAPGKFTDDQGQPVEWKNEQEHPLTVNEFLMSPALAEKFGNDYSQYRDAFGKAARGPAGGATPAAAGGAAQPTAGATPTAAAPGFKHTDVLTEMKRRGLTQ